MLYCLHGSLLATTVISFICATGLMSVAHPIAGAVVFFVYHKPRKCLVRFWARHSSNIFICFSQTGGLVLNVAIRPCE